MHPLRGRVSVSYVTPHHSGRICNHHRPIPRHVTPHHNGRIYNKRQILEHMGRNSIQLTIVGASTPDHYQRVAAPPPQGSPRRGLLPRAGGEEDKGRRTYGTRAHSTASPKGANIGKTRPRDCFLPIEEKCRAQNRYIILTINYPPAPYKRKYGIITRKFGHNRKRY